MNDELGKIINKLVSYGLNNRQVEEVADDIDKLIVQIAQHEANDAVNSALDSLARFGR